MEARNRSNKTVYNYNILSIFCDRHALSILAKQVNTKFEDGSFSPLKIVPSPTYPKSSKHIATDRTKVTNKLGDIKLKKDKPVRKSFQSLKRNK